ncbi:hypothetical protein LRM35_03350 [Klebsiella variicola subsp. variicola]|nr:hypothetical protein LRM35_03350 [Klebsiella variicola subsp. variicola]
MAIATGEPVGVISLPLLLAVIEVFSKEIVIIFVDYNVNDGRFYQEWRF